ncbi:MAG: hypothetical protein DRO15_05165 [Thermoprotei archaeon]|nr:MAG: hypothetical protein DRO15_05165 [Thermoprotei archaeon]
MSKEEERYEYPKESEELLKKLEELANTMKDWERKPLVKVGRAIVELIKLPKRETSKRLEPERLALHIRLEDSFKGIFVVESGEFQDIVEALKTKIVTEVAKALDAINRKKRVIEYGL